MTPTPLQRLSEIVEAGTPGKWTFERSDRRGAWIGADGSWSALTCGNTDAEATANATFIVSAVRLARFLCSPEAVEVLARALDPEAWQGAPEWVAWSPQLWEKGMATSASLRRATACLNTIAEQALKRSQAMDERDIVERAEAWLAAGYGGEVQAGIIGDLLSALSTTQAELANSKERHRLTELDSCRANSRANELQAQLDAAKDPRAHQGALVQYRDKCDAAEEALATLRARVVEAGGPFAERWRNHKSGYIASIPMVPVLREDVQAMANLIEEVSKVTP